MAEKLAELKLILEKTLKSEVPYCKLAWIV